MQGRIVKGISGFYYVQTKDNIIECKSRGKFRHDELSPMVGDKVDISCDGRNEGVIEKIYPRRSQIIRPAVANVTQALVVFSIKNPEINFELLNKLLVNCEYSNLKVVVCLNKLDLNTPDEYSVPVDMIDSAKYEIIFLRAKQGIGIDKIREILKNEITVLCGPSGVGKSTILNQIAGRKLMDTGSISEKLKRGKHTTRHSQLIQLENGYIVDTPGFSSLKIDSMDKEELSQCFPEFREVIGKCKFNSCLHYREPHCAVKDLVEKGVINKLRYDFYIKMLLEITSRKNYK